MCSRKFTRRRALTYTTLTVASSAVLQSRTVGSVLAAHPDSNGGTVVIYVVAPAEGTISNPRFYQEAYTLFNESHKGIEARVYGGIADNRDDAMAAIISGSQVPDAFDGFTLSEELPVMRDISDLIRRDNVDLGVFSAGHVDALRRNGGLYGLPSFSGTNAWTINLGLLDAFGLTYPSPDWTYREFADFVSAATRVVHGTRIFGAASSYLYSGASVGGLAADYWLKNWGGSRIDPADHSKCWMDQAGSVAFGRWLAGLCSRNVVTGGNWYPATRFVKGPVVAHHGFMQGVANMLTVPGIRGIKFDFWPEVTGPVDDRVMVNHDSWMIPGTARHPEEGWTFIKWAATEPTWQRYMMRLTLLPPALRSLQPEFEEVLKTVAPPLRGKRVNAWTDPMIADRAYTAHAFTYANSEAVSLIANWWSKAIINYGSYPQHLGISITEAFTQATRQVDALEATAASASGRLAGFSGRAQALFARANRTTKSITYPSPARAALLGGPAPVNAGRAMTVQPSGSVQVRSEGSGGITGPGDNCVFAGSPFVQSRGTVECRLVSISAPRGGALAAGAKIGLMARQDFSTAGQVVGVCVAVDRGLHSFARRVTGGGVAFADEKNGSMVVHGATASAPPGLLASAAVQVAATPRAGGNWLLRPVWLRLMLDVNTWTPYISRDGERWDVAGNPVGVDYAGAWVGVFATSHAAHQTISAVFDHLSGFAPETAVRIGLP